VNSKVPEANIPHQSSVALSRRKTPRELLAYWGRLYRYFALYRRFQPHTMIKRALFWRNLELAWQFREVPGLIVECGVWRGGMSAALASVLGPRRSYYLFDSFEGLPAPKEIDGPAANAWSQDTTGEYYHDNCRADLERAATAMRMAGVASPRLVKGWFSDTLPTFNPEEPIAILRLDGDWYDSTICCLENLFHRVQPGGLIIFDDYCVWDGCTRAVHDFLSSTGASEPLRQFANEISYMIKR
jgi:O-methyltransferase